MPKLWNLPKVSQTKLITFTEITPVSRAYDPQPASKFLPEWYKITANRIGKKDPDGTPTVKKCIPVFDAITSGYILVTSFDVYIKQVDGEPVYQTTPSKRDMVQFHPVMQASKHPAANGFQYPKWINPWSIKTPKGYSVLFVPPMHNPNPWFQILEGVVDTDSYTAPVNFPFILKDPSFEGMIPAGTPMAQVIPFKRESWKLEFGSKELKEKQTEIFEYLQSQFFDRYKRMFWSRKEYK